jgi:molybdopterin-guanine dinucleotide biosynthesis protein B
VGKAVAFTGPSNSGKTTLITKIATLLTNDYKVCIVKNDPKDKARFDVEGKDSDIFYKTGAEVAVVSPTRTTLFSHETRSIDEIVSLFGEFDYLFVEGLKTLPLPRIGIFRGVINEDYLDVIDVLAVDTSINTSTIPPTLKALDLNNPEEVLEWINNNAKEITR